MAVPGSSESHPDVAARQRWLAVLARADRAALESAWEAVPDKPGYQWLRRPETGLVMVRARAGGTGQKFNLGEMTATRCTVQMEGGVRGVGYVRGRDARHAELIALFDGLLQEGDRCAAIQRDTIGPLAAAQQDARLARARKVNATRVEFVTLVRGENPE
jgi:alpha-D-ribose 1-methylphosphonate 5-triphosphate synthase subunit PhnG